MLHQYPLDIYKQMDWHTQTGSSFVQQQQKKKKRLLQLLFSFLSLNLSIRAEIFSLDVCIE